MLNNFQTIIRKRTKDSEIVVAQRLKRQITIVDKLFREAGMKLARMDDVAGCRIIFPDNDSLHAFRTEFHKSNFRHKRKNNLDKYDYIKKPKGSGYRGIHDIYAYDARSIKGAVYSGLMIELQYRTVHQHAWATACELIAQMTGNEPKFGRGDENHIEYFRLASEIIARAFEGLPSCYPDMTNAVLIEKFSEMEEATDITFLLRSLRIFDVVQVQSKSIILQLSKDSGLKVHQFKTTREAEEQYFEFEKGDLFDQGKPKDDFVLVSGEAFSHVRSAYQNYFSDARGYLLYIKDGCEKLRNTH